MKRKLFVIVLLLCAALSAMADTACDHDAPYEFDAENHWAICKKCGVMVDQGCHGTFCTDDGTCAWCDYDGIVSNVLHRNWSFVGNADEHWENCKDCGQKSNYGKHMIECDKPGVCRDCGQPCDEKNAYIEHITHYEFDAESHWAVCPNCDVTVDQGCHGTFCTDDGTCAWCDYDGVVTNVLHLQEKFVAEGDGHWVSCLDCDKQLYFAEHAVRCGKPGVCEGCGAECETEPFHYREGELVYDFDEEYHWWCCDACGERVGQEKHQNANDNSGKCRTCGAEYMKKPGGHTHAYDETARTDASCGADGEITYACNCGDSYTRKIPALAHEYETTALRQPTCEERGMKEMTCKHCGEKIRTCFGVVDHNYKVVSQVAPSGGQKGMIVSACVYCGKEITRFTAY